MNKMILKPINSGYEVYSEHFRKKGYFVVDQVDLKPNGLNDKKLVAVVKVHLRECPDFKVEATSDKFHF